MIGQGGVDDAKHFGPVAEPVRKRQPLAFRLPQAKLHRAQAAKREKYVLCAGRDRHQVDRAVKPLEPLLVPRHEAEQQVRVTRKILGARLDREIDAMGVGRKEKRRRPGVVEDDAGAARVRDLGDRGDVLDLERQRAGQIR